MANTGTGQIQANGAACLATSTADMTCERAGLGNRVQEFTAAVIIIQKSAK